MKKLTCILLTLSMILTILSACNQGENVVDPKPNTDDQQQDVKDPNEESALSETLDLVVDGVSDYVIVRGENAYISEITAATELQSYLKQITGTELPIVTDTAPEAEREIIVGKTNRETEGEFNREELGDEGFIIKTNGTKLCLVGGEQRGTLYSVYEFLESYLGCRFYTGEVEKIPETKTISLEKIEEDKQIPIFEYRDMDWVEYTWGGSNNITVKRRINARNASEEFGGHMSYVLWCHTMIDLVPPSVYYAEHPEYYCETYEGGSDAWGAGCQPCLSNPEVLKIATESVRNYLKNSSGNIISISQNDNQDYCTCDNCNKIFEEEGSQAGVLLRFVNAIATELKDEFPNAIFDTLDYQYTRNKPLVTKPVENVCVRLCSIECCFSHPLSECEDVNKSDRESKKFSETLSDWASISERLYVWDYTTNFAHYALTFPNFNVLRENLRFFADNNVVGVFEEGKREADSSEFGELRAYLLAKLMWDPYMTEEEYQYHINDFLEGVYGKGWTFIREYIDLAQDQVKDTCFAIYDDPDEIFIFPKAIEIHKQKEYPEDLTSDMIRNYESVDWTQYWNFFRDIPEIPTIISEGYRLFDLALEAAETEEQKSRIGEAKLQVDYINSYYLSKKLGFGGSAIGKILLNYFNAHADEFTDQEQSDLRISIVKLSRTQAYNTYIEFNTKLLNDHLAYGINSIKEHYYFSADLNWSGTRGSGAMDMSQVPNNWYIEN